MVGKRYKAYSWTKQQLSVVVNTNSANETYPLYLLGLSLNMLHSYFYRIHNYLLLVLNFSLMLFTLIRKPDCLLKQSD